ncbi:AAA family ATPase [Candidatus Microgenomates bacterium]|nr:AAA family ATPase [Candidatus Microgenomates bacterium]
MKQKIILIGMKACGKTTVGKFLAKKLKIQIYEVDQEIENKHQKLKKEKLTFREIFKKYGKDYFRNLETSVLENLAEKLKNRSYILSCGGGTVLSENNQKIIRKMGTIIFLNTDKKILLDRIAKDGIPTFFPDQDDPARSLNILMKERLPVYKKLANIIINIKNETLKEIVNKILEGIYEN